MLVDPRDTRLPMSPESQGRRTTGGAGVTLHGGRRQPIIDATLCLLITLGTLLLPTSPASGSTRARWRLTVGHALAAGQSLKSRNQEFMLTMQRSGDLLESFEGRTLWSTHTSGHRNALAILQRNGVLAVKMRSGRTLWSSRSGSHVRARYSLALLASGVLTISSPGAHVLWSSKIVASELETGESLSAGQSITSSNCRYLLAMKTDGNLVESFEGRTLWSTHTSGHRNARAILQPNGVLAVKMRSGRTLWSSGSGGHVRARYSLALLASGVLMISSPRGPVLWSSKTVASELDTGGSLSAGQSITSPNGQYVLAMQTDGNLVVYGPSGALWASGTSGAGNHVVMQSDGNLVVYNSAGAALWQSGTGGRSGAFELAMQSDGNLVIYSAGGPIWSWESAVPIVTPAEQTAVAWASSFLGTAYDSGLCLTFVFAAWSAAGVNLRDWVNVPIGSNTYPVDIWGHFTHGTTGTGMDPPVGSLVFFASRSGDVSLSHVAISVGGGEMISTTDAINESVVHYETVAAHAAYANYLGWWLPDA